MTKNVIIQMPQRLFYLISTLVVEEEAESGINQYQSQTENLTFLNFVDCNTVDKETERRKFRSPR